MLCARRVGTAWFGRFSGSLVPGIGARYRGLLAASLLPLLLSACDISGSPRTAPGEEGSEVFVYSARSDHLVAPVFDAFTADTGISVHYLTDSAAPLLERMRSEGARTKADLLLTVDAGNLWQAKQRGLLMATDSPLLKSRIPVHLRDPEGHWFGLSLRARVIVYHKDRVDPAEIDNYAGLADPRWRGRLCLRTSRKVYSQSLVASLISRYGEARARDIVKGWVDNLALAPFSSDTRALQAVLAGKCDLTIVNSYYLARLEREWQSQSRDTPLLVYVPPAESGGVHINVSGAGVSAHARHIDEALRLLEWLSSKRAQYIYAHSNLEYPVDQDVAVSRILLGWGDLPFDDMSVAQYGVLQQRSIMLMDSVGYR